MPKERPSVDEMKCHGEIGMFYLGVLTGIHKDKTHMNVTSNLTCGYDTVILA